MLTGQPFYFVLHMTNKNYYAGNPYLFFGAKIILPPRILPYTIAPNTLSSPPPPWPPVVAETLAILVVRVNYIVPLKQHTLLPPDTKRVVGTLKDGYVRNVPLPRVPRIQSAKLIAPSRCIPEGTTPSRCIPVGTPLPDYLRVSSWIPTLPKIGSLLEFSQRVL